MNGKKYIKITNITMMHETSGRSGGFCPVPQPVPPEPRDPEPEPPKPEPCEDADRCPDPTMLHVTSGRDGFDPLPLPPSVIKELLFEKYKGKFDRWLKNVPCGIEDDIKEYILSQLN